MLSFCATVVAVVLSSLTNSVNGEEATCGQCLPIMEGSDAFIHASLWKTTDDPKEYVKAVDETFTSIQRNTPGFISFAAAATDDPSVFLFYDIFDSEENSIAASKAVTNVEDFDFDFELLTSFRGTVT
jgi:quinol monooxygenase YgiN